MMVTRLVGPRLLGREREREVLERLLEGARAGHGGALVLHGEPGVGKTALLELRGRGRQTTSGSSAPPGSRERWSCPYAALAAALCTDPRSDRAPARSAARRAQRRVRAQRGTGARSVPRRARGARSVVGGGRGAPAALPRRRRAVAGPMRRLARSRSSRAGSSRRGSCSCSRPASEAPRLAASPRSTSGPWDSVMPGSCWSPCCPLASMSECSSASWPGDAREPARAARAARAG